MSVQTTKRSQSASGRVLNCNLLVVLTALVWTPLATHAAEPATVAVRVFPHAHTNPIYVVVNEQPIRGPMESARLCPAGTEQCWKSKQSTYAANELVEAEAAYAHARDTFRRLMRDAAQP